MRIGGIRGSDGFGRVTGRALVPVTAAARAEPDPDDVPFRDGSAAGRGGSGGGSAMPGATRWHGPLLAQLIGGTGRPEAPPRRRIAPGEAGRAYDDALRRPDRLAPGSVFARSV